MKILFCPAHYAHLNNRGSEIEWAYRITNSLAEQNNNSVVVTGFTNIKSPHYNIVELQPTKSQINLGLINTIYFALSYGMYAVKILRQNAFDIHHHVLPFSLGRSFNLAFIFPKKNVKRIIGPIQKPIPAYADNLHDPLQRLSRVQLLKNTLLNAFVAVFALPLNVLSSLTLRRADVLVAINDDVREALIKKGCEAQKIIVIPPGLNTGTFTRNGEQGQAKKNGLTLLTTGALIKRKGTEILIQGFAEALRKTDTKLVLKIVGDGPQRAYLEELVRSLHIDSHVIFCGHHDHKNMPSFYRDANVFISMSRAESWGQMYLEAMSSGLAILTTRNDGSTFIINNKINGVFVKTENSHDLAKKIIHLATNRELLRSLQKSARATALEYDWEKKIIPKYVRMYKNLLDS